ncbi:MAG: hypothetical protein UR89_C0033G0003 [Candidatus Roizmanbacteria bacterium GW2011_GWA2_35_8]|uniref:Uncharacterized protein n=1 Tax=Candidatus Roizmanbacteria bacterium GW2011_GWA2_35_8 TaxID=1618479 RepID=A0A0G0FFC5_9BACT|nr:MAG: hypothetical protein UR89_C0033G0003 [Candidatus Roizmanbacteria bacterium GW2011_GWA2_35_8]
MPEKLKPIRLTSFLYQVKELSKKYPLSFEQRTIEATTFSPRSSAEMVEQLKREKIMIPESVLAGFRIDGNDSKNNWLISQEERKQGFIAMRFDKNRGQVSLDDANVIIGVEFDKNGQANRIILSGIGKGNNALAAEYLHHSGLKSGNYKKPRQKRIGNDELVLNSVDIGIRNKIIENNLQLEHRSISPYLTSKIIKSSESHYFLRLYNPWNDDNPDNLEYWSRNGEYIFNQDKLTVEYYGLVYSFSCF